MTLPGVNSVIVPPPVVVVVVVCVELPSGVSVLVFSVVVVLVWSVVETLRSHRRAR